MTVGSQELYGMPGDDDHKRWRDALAKLGPSFIRNRLDTVFTGKAPDSEVHEIVDRPPHPSRGFVEAWYGETLRRLKRSHAARRAAVTVAVTLVVIVGVLAITFW